jgi:signal transduction histidine kinase/HD-like signal output (HDOD) protein
MPKEPPKESPPPSDDFKTRKVELVLQQLDSLPTLPAVAVRLLTLTGSTESKIQEVVALISSDISLTSKILSLASSAHMGVKAPITNVQQAVVMLGFETIRNLALSVKVFEAFQHRPEEPGEDPAATVVNRAEFWKHSLAVAAAAELLAARCKPRLNAGDAFVCGLLHDIGKVAFDTAMPKSFARVVEMATMTRGDLADVERRVIGLDHGLAGKRLAEAWSLPQLLTQVIWLHGSPPPVAGAGTHHPFGQSKVAGLVSLPLVLVVGLADMLVRRQHIGFSGNYLFPYEVEQYTAHLGLSGQDVDDVTEHLADALESRAKSIGLYDVESRQLYLESIANANAELGRVNQQLAVQNRKLTTRSTCFEILTRFYQRIVPTASPAQLLTEIGQVAHAFFESQRLVLFSQDPDEGRNEDLAAASIGPRTTGGIGEVLFFDPAQPAQDSRLVKMPPYGGDQRVGKANQNFIRPASPQLDWLLEHARGFLGTTHCWFMPILCGNEPVGGVLWAAKDNMNSQSGVADLVLISQSWGMTLRTAQIREQQTVLMEELAADKRELGSLQQQLVRNKSLASLGEMAAGAAHEMNNPLAVISGRAQLLAAKLTDQAMKQEATLIAQQGERLSQIITDMMEFAKPLTPKMGPLNVSVILEEAVKVANEKAAGLGGAGIKVRIDPPGGGAGLPPCHGDSRQLHNAVAEVILNAMQATKHAEGEGRATQDVVVQTRVDPLDQQLIIQVTDRGVGMSDEVLKNAFAPFFSAKSAGRNRGMGLAKALRWVENHGGTIRLDSTLGSGTTVVIILPLGSETDVAEAPAAPVHAKR